MNKEEFDMLPSDGRIPCPKCGSTKTRAFPGCDCRELTAGKKIGFVVMRYGFHINKYHHDCEEKR